MEEGYSGPVLALYDFRDKQGYIYRTNRIREITGASEILAKINGMFLGKAAEEGISINAAWKGAEGELRPPQEGGEVVYDGGGNLCILYKDREAYRRANSVFSRLVLDKAYSLQLVAACTEWTGDFSKDYKNARTALRRAKNCGNDCPPCNVLPFTKVDNVTFQPIVDERKIEGESEPQRLSQESVCKLAACKKYEQGRDAWTDWGRELDSLAQEKGVDSLIAIVYLDGNSITGRLDSIKTVAEMRQLSLEIQDRLVNKPMEAVRRKLEELAGGAGAEKPACRFVIGNGDENTLICNAHLVPDILNAYFAYLSEENEQADDAGKYYACAGIAVCHAHDPYSSVYRIAEECCKSAKATNRKAMREGADDGCYIDFHYCRSGITGTLEQIRNRHEADCTLRPYQVGDEGGRTSWNTFREAGEALRSSKLTRGDVKDLGRLAHSGSYRYELKLEHARAKDPQTMETVEELADNDTETLRKILFDVSAFFDMWFPAKEQEVGE